jgi:uncharacterized protein (TIGR02453 family)
MPYFDQEFIRFYEDLAAHNYKEWFQEQRQRYEACVKSPFRKFVADLIERVQAFDPSIQIEPKDAVFRVNRDIRFSNDKRPYKHHAAASLTPDKRKSRFPGYYVHMGPEEGVFLGGGAYFLPKEDLPQIQRAIAAEPERFRAILDDPDLCATYGPVLGETYKRVPKGYEALEETVPEIKHKQFYFANVPWPIETILEADFLEQVAQRLALLAPFNQFMREALLGKPKAQQA